MDSIQDRIAFDFMAKKVPTELFKRVFYEINEQTKKENAVKFEKARASLQEHLNKALIAQGYKVVSVEVKLAKFRGHPYITSAPVVIVVKSDKEAHNILNYLISIYSPKYMLKEVAEGKAFFNVR